MSDPADRLVLLESERLGLASNPRDSEKATRCKAWLRGLLAAGVRVMVPEVIDYEVRRELIRAGRSRGVSALDAIGRQLGLLPCSGAVLIEAAGLWAEARRRGQPTADDKALDIDLAHLSRYAPAELGDRIAPRKVE